MIQRYVSKISGPLLDHIDMPTVKYRELREDAGGEASEKIRERVVAARRRQLTRYQGEKIYCNAQMSSRQIARYCNISADCEKLLENAMSRLGLSAHAHDRILKVARTVAALGPRNPSRPITSQKPSNIARSTGITGLDGRIPPGGLQVGRRGPGSL